MYRITHRRSPGKKFHRRLLGLTTALALVLTALVVACGEPEPEPRAEPTDTPRALSPLSVIAWDHGYAEAYEYAHP